MIVLVYLPIIAVLLEVSILCGLAGRAHIVVMWQLQMKCTGFSNRKCFVRLSFFVCFLMKHRNLVKWTS